GLVGVLLAIELFFDFLDQRFDACAELALAFGGLVRGYFFALKQLGALGFFFVALAFLDTGLRESFFQEFLLDIDKFIELLDLRRRALLLFLFLFGILFVFVVFLIEYGEEMDVALAHLRPALGDGVVVQGVGVIGDDFAAFELHRAQFPDQLAVGAARGGVHAPHHELFFI